MTIPGPRSWAVLLAVPPLAFVYTLSRVPVRECALPPAPVVAAVTRAEPAPPAPSVVAPAPPRPPRLRPAPVAEHIRAAAARHGVPERLLAAVVGVESEFNPRAVSPRGARGLMQLMPQTAALLGVRDPFEPRQNVHAGARHLRDLLDRYGDDVPLALAAYNAGIGAVLTHGGIPPYPETRAFVTRVMARFDDQRPVPAGAVTADGPHAPVARTRLAAARAPARTGIVGTVRVAKLGPEDDGIVLPVTLSVPRVAEAAPDPAEAPRAPDAGAWRTSPLQAP